MKKISIIIGAVAWISEFASLMTVMHFLPADNYEVAISRLVVAFFLALAAALFALAMFLTNGLKTYPLSIVAFCCLPLFGMFIILRFY